MNDIIIVMKDLVPVVDSLIDINSRNSWNSINRKSDIILRKNAYSWQFCNQSNEVANAE